ncbi:MAG: hypothetical protein COZ46_01110 [Verrucomicrobia bacterium CG_4_10_14_3_um_filter_43_23]|nr:MAG: hypothetical protein COX01_01715 [Verrucomicrobia bacterium CG22_combo_CG10-13_8_21_14_all_43_17]PIX58979.1 MAG: hypothetical protein COZ46_01110 [Verrucomicrobia bacterium CG_4_10_14_3_um_filter_43_23]PIY62753.1 MAG: hypothetical protein COY94_01130 [Verrucomicrobia bacterium CG_4_10_14_0_8_um_filter_43_34]PJA44037.1 MAG: hypothetical protein CO175_04920 [Verrucomicrobia bacterium CG_4_9_14_3_um_filter_43_20]
MVQETIKCYRCGSQDVVKNGKAPNGKQSRENPSENGYSEQKREKILKAYGERSCLRGLQRVFGVAPKTVIEWLKKKPRT